MMVKPQRLRSGVLLCSLAFVLLFAYAIARPSTESMFLGTHGADALPWAWLGVATVCVPVVALYNWGAARMSLGRVTLWAIATSALSLAALLGLVRAQWSGSTFALYIWKDVHIVVLLEVLWSFANLVFDKRSARWLNGLFCACGSLGGLCGNTLVGPLAHAWGTHATPLLLLPLFAVEAVLVVQLAAAAGQPAPKERVKIDIDDAVRLLRKSPYLGWLVLLIGTVQIAINLVDFVYADAIAAAYPDTDARTAIMGQIYGAIDVASLTLQLLSGLVVGALGVRATLLAIPTLLGAAVFSFVAAPHFALMAVAKVASKALDYSLFRTTKEMLYLPLSYDDKTRGKALVDMLTYRVAKGAASLVILGLGAIGAGMAVMFATLSTIGVWFAVTLQVTKRYHALISSSESSTTCSSPRR